MQTPTSLRARQSLNVLLSQLDRSVQICSISQLACLGLSLRAAGTPRVERVTMPQTWHAHCAPSD